MLRKSTFNSVGLRRRHHMKSNNTKVIAAYLPQFHEIPENNKWWGKGYTDWVAVKKAEPQFVGHDQPKIPLNSNYYSLDDTNTIRWQANMAREHGIYGLGIYHYWFSSEQQLLTKPAEILRENKDIDINYCFIWDNNSWVNKTWKNIKFTNEWAPSFSKDNGTVPDDGMLAELKYGSEKEWGEHYQYLRTFFSDNRYIRLSGKPVFGIFAPTNNYEVVKKMCSYMNKLAIQDGYPGIYFISAAGFSRKRLDMDFRYEPFNVTSPFDYIKRHLMKKKNLKIYNYDKVWKKILFNAYFLRSSKTIYGGFVGYDDTPRRGNKANIIVGQTPEKFKKYFAKLYIISKRQNKPFIYLTAWNEWGEGAYMEPDSRNGYRYLNALKEIIDNYGSEE